MKTRLPLFLLLSMSCAQPLPLDMAPCPCAQGWVCCPGSQVCADDASHCPAPAAPVVTPASATVSVTRRLAFSTPDAVTFAVEEPNGGAIDASGLYTAPTAPGTYHVTATLNGTSISTGVEVTVVPLQLAPLAGRYGGLSSRPIDGTGEDARFAGPQGGVFVDGFYYLTDGDELGFAGTTSLRRIERATGKVETLFAGSFIPYPGLNLGPVMDGARGTATFASPGALASDGNGQLLIADACLIRSVRLSDLSVTTLMGDPSLSSCAQDGFVRGVASDGADTVFFSVGDRFFGGQADADSVINALTVSTGNVALLAGQLGVHGTADGAAGTFSDVGLLAYDKQSGSAAQLLALDDLNQRVRAVDLAMPTHAVSTLQGPAGAPYVEVSVPPAAAGGMVIRADGSLTPEGSKLQMFHQQLPVRPTGLAVTQIPIASGGNLKPPCDGTSLCPVLLVPTADGTFDQFNLYLGLLDTLAGRLGAPPEARDGSGQSASFALAARAPVIAAAGDTVFAWEASRSIRKIDRLGNVTTAWTGVDASLLAGSSDTLYLATTWEIRQAKISGGEWTSVAGGTPGPQLDGIGAAATFTNISSLIVEPAGTLIVLDTDNGGTKLRRVNPANAEVKTISTLPGMLNGSVLSFAFPTPGAAMGPAGKLIALSNYGVHEIDIATGAADDLFLNTMTGNPYTAVAYDAGRVYLGNGSVVDQLDVKTKQVTRLVGSPGDGAVRPGALEHALLHNVSALATLPNGDLLVLDAAERVLMQVR